MKETDTAAKRSKYLRQIIGRDGVAAMVDVYDVLDAFGVTNQMIGHALKKLLCPGQRGHKSFVEDLHDAKTTIEAAIEKEQARKPKQ